MKKETIYLSLVSIDEYSTSSLIDYEYISGFTDLSRKNESIVARSELERLTLKYLGKTLEELSFKKDAFGKPTLKTANCSISHSSGWVFVGLCTGNTSFGIDIEQVKHDDWEHLRIAFSDEEWQKISQDSVSVFFGFSLKESIAKQIGKGFLIEPSEIKIPKNCNKLKWLMTLNETKFVITFFSEKEVEIIFDKINISCKLVSYNENN